MAQDQHHHYDHYTPEMAARLDGFYGAVDDRMNARIRDHVCGRKVLDVGCGFGQLVEHLRVRGFEATGVDLLEFCLTEGRKRYPEADLRLVEGDRLPFSDLEFDTVVLKDVFHHIYGERNAAQFLGEIKRITRHRLIVLDPNPTWILLLSRKLISHTDPVCTPQDVCRLLEDSGFKIATVRYDELVAFPLSGGFVGPVLVPSGKIGSLVLAVDSALRSAVQILGLSKMLCWRFQVVADVGKR